MNESITTAVDTPVFECPAWCEKHDAGRRAICDGPTHMGPQIGSLRIWFDDEEDRYYAETVEPDATYMPIQLRKLAQEATQAADWIEDHIRAGRVFATLATAGFEDLGKLPDSMTVDQAAGFMMELVDQVRRDG